MAEARIGVIGGSGLYEMQGLEILFERKIETPFGDPSDPFVIGEVDGRRVVFLSRHGKGHRYLPGEINYRANIYGMKVLGVEMILSASAVGSMKEAYAPTDIVFPDQFIDRTRQRPDTFFGNGIVGHVSFADPICRDVQQALAASSRRVGAKTHVGGTYVCMEGPQFSTRAESYLYRSWGVDVIGMTNLQEAKLAREAEICYATMALVTDYDCWHETEEAVSVETVIGYLQKNASTACAIIRDVIGQLEGRERGCACVTALKFALLTDPSVIPAKVKESLAPIIGKYVA
ncbi:MAG TPA: S-methyl-5'-thioadenosine phosphorylase [Thermoanaerobaculia bacterium]|nr:S-methyl-5'-thioadenosine phosphorylase [Thermoanaerobaculia bacterium]